MTDVEFEDDTSYETERPLLVCKGNYDLELGLALSESLNPSDTLLATNPQVRKLYNLQIDLFLSRKDGN